MDPAAPFLNQEIPDLFIALGIAEHKYKWARMSTAGILSKSFYHSERKGGKEAMVGLSGKRKRKKDIKDSVR